MPSPATILATHRPELRDGIEQIVDLGWLVSAWTLRTCSVNNEKAKPFLKYSHEIEYHLKLLPIFLGGAAEDIRESPEDRWLAEFNDALRRVASHLNEEERPSLSIYEAVPKCIESFKHGASSENITELVHLANLCLGAMKELQQWPSSDDATVSSRDQN
jgi:hypothetical protein